MVAVCKANPHEPWVDAFKRTLPSFMAGEGRFGGTTQARRRAAIQLGRETSNPSRGAEAASARRGDVEFEMAPTRQTDEEAGDVQDQTEEQSSMAQELEASVASIATLQDEIARATTNIQSLKDESGSLKDENASLKDENASLKDKVDAMTAELQTLAKSTTHQLDRALDSQPTTMEYVERRALCVVNIRTKALQCLLFHRPHHLHLPSPL